MNSRKPLARLLAVSLLTLGGISSVVSQTTGTVFVVNSNADATGDTTPGDGFCGQVTSVPSIPPGGAPTTTPVANSCTLRAAIQEVNGRNNGADSISFNLAPTGNATTVTITLASALPAITTQLAIDGSNKDGNGNSRPLTVSGNNQFSLLRFTPPGTGTNTSSGSYSIKAITLSGGVNGTATGGAGIYFGATFPSKLTLDNVIVSGNSAAASGNGPTATTGGPGGGIAVADGNALIVNGGRITGNSALRGGGIAIVSATNGPTGVADNNLGNPADDVLTLTNTVMSGNSATVGNGGAIHADLGNGGDVVLTGVDLGGTATGEANTAVGDGGGIWISAVLGNSDLLVDGSTIRNNTAVNGAGVTVKQGTLQLRNSTLSANTASGNGGGLWLDTQTGGTSGGAARISNVTFSGNRATGATSAGGAIAANATNPASSSMVHATLADNTAAAMMGGGLSATAAQFPGNFSNPFTSNVFANAGTGGNCRVALGHNDSSNAGFERATDGSCGFTQASDREGVDLKLGALTAKNSPVTRLLPLVRPLLAGSPAIDAANPNYATATDERGADKQDGGADGDPTNGPAVRDIGAYEFGGYGLVEFFNAGDASASFTVDENKTPAVVVVRRSGTGTAVVDSTITVQNPTTGTGAATVGSDYTTIGTGNAKTLELKGPSPATAMLNIDITNDRETENDETIALVLATTAAAPFNDLGARNPGTVTIKDVENGTFRFEPLTYMVSEGAASAQLTVTRTGGSAGRVRLTFNSGDSACTPAATCRATADTDYVKQTASTVVFENGATSATISIPLKEDMISEMGEEFTVTLSAPTCVDANNNELTSVCDAQLNATAANNTATVTITDNDGPLTVSIGDATATESEATQTDALEFKVMLSKPSSSVVTVRYATANGPNGQAAGGTSCPAATTPATDYITKTAAAATELSFAPGETEKTATVTLCGDAAFEGDEKLLVNLSAVSGATLGDGQGEGTIVENDAMPTQGVVGFKNTGETAAEATPVKSTTFTVTRTGNNPTSTTVSATFAVTNPGYSTFSNNGACTTDAAGPDYRISSTNPSTGSTGTVVAFSASNDGTGTITFNGNVTSDGTTATEARLIVEACNDTRRESDQIVTLKLGAPSNEATAGPSTATLTVQSDEKPRFQIAPATLRVREGDDAMASLTVQPLEAVDGEPVCLPFASNNGSATAGSDYTAISSPSDPCKGSLVWKNGESDTKPLSVMIVDDGDTPTENDETFTVDLGTAPGANVVVAQSTVTIASLPRIYFNPKTYRSTGETGTIVFEVMRTANSGASSVEVVFTDGSGSPSATLGTDFTTTPASGVVTVNFAANETGPKTVTATISADTAIEGNETFDVRLRNPSNATLSPTTQTPVFVNGTIEDDDFRFEFSAANATVAENVTGGNAVLTVNRVGTSLSAATVQFAVAAGTATAGSDYTVPQSMTVNFPAGTGGSQTISIPVTNDTLDEVDETFTVTLNSPSAPGTLGTPASSTVTITDDDDAPTIRIASASRNEGDMAEQPLAFTLTLSAASSKAVSVTATTANGTANSGSDYTSTTQMVMIPAGQTTATFEVPVKGDTLSEPDETFTVTLSNPSNATFANSADSTATGTIVNDDAQPTVSLALSAATLAEKGGSSALTAVLNRAYGSDVTVTLAYGGTASTPADYATPATTVTIPAGQTVSNAVTLTATDDALDEADETIVADIASNSGGFAKGTPAQVTATITDDDATPGLSVNDVTVTEGNSGSRDAGFTVSLSAASGRTVTVAYATANGTATAGSDYTAASGALSFAPGETSKTVAVAVLGDTLPEANETFALNLSNAVNAGLARASGTGTISNDDAVPTLSIADASVTEGSSGTTSMNFTVTLSAASSLAVTVNYATANGSATAGSDYTATSGTLTIPAGQTTASFAVPVAADTSDESDETLTVTLSNPANATITRGQATGTIVDDDTAPATATANDAQGRSLRFSSSAGGFEGLASTTQPANAPATSSYDNGFFTYTIAGLATGGSATVTVTLPTGSSATSYVNCPSNCTTGGSGSGQTVSITLVDGGPDDADGVANGRILVKAGAAARAVSTGGGGGGGGGSGGGGGGGGSFGASLLLGLLALAGLRRRRFA